MSTLLSLIPDVNNLLILTADELAQVLLQLSQEHAEHGKIHFSRIYNMAIGEGPNRTESYARRWHPEVAIALGEAWNWLMVNGLLIAEPRDTPGTGWMVLTRKAKKILAEGTFKTYARSVELPKSMIHPSIADSVWIELVSGDLDSAVFKAFKAVEVAVRTAGNFPATLLGDDLMRKAFNENTGPLTDMTLVTSERLNLSHLFAGAIGVYKNPQSHRVVNIQDQTEAFEMVVFASHLLRIVDSRRPTGVPTP